MATLSIYPSYPHFRDTAGNPLENGNIYVGTAGSDAVSNQINIFWDSALSVPASQPVRTIGGHPNNNGSPGMLYMSGTDYSLAVLDKNNVPIYSALNVTDISYANGSSDLTAHEADTATHGATGEVVGTTNTQTLTNKTISGGSLSGTITNSGTISGGTLSAPTLSGTVTNSGTISGGTLASPTLSGTLSGGTIGAVTINSSATIAGEAITAGSIPAASLATGVAGTSTLYCTPAGSGDGSGVDSSNRVSAANLPALLQDGSTFKLIMAAGDYTTTDVAYPFSSISAGVDFGSLTNKNIFVAIEGSVTLGAIDSKNSTWTFGATSTGYTITFADDVLFVLSKVSFLGDEKTSFTGPSAGGDLDDVASVIFNSGVSFTLSTSDLFCSSITLNTSQTFSLGECSRARVNAIVSASRVEVEEGSTLRLGGSSTITNAVVVADNSALTMDSGTLTCDTISVSYRGFIGGASSTLTMATASQITLGSFCRFSSYGTATPTADATSDVV